MKDAIRWTENRMPAHRSRYLPLMSPAQAEETLAFHRSFPQYARTPLAQLKGLAGQLGLAELRVKDESFRFGLNAFKVLGGSYAMAKYIAKQTGQDIARMTYGYLTGEELARDFGQATFFTATDGNHGRGVAWAAGRLNQRAVVRMPRGTAASRLENIAKEGAEVTIEEMNYDDCVRLAAAQAAETPNGVLLQDTAWPGYEDIPSWIMQGYATMAAEAAEQMEQRPTHVFVQAGVGSMAGAVVGYFANRFPDDPPKFVVMEASAADCLYQSALAGDGTLRAVGGDLQTMMAGLACGEGNPIAWDILRACADVFVSCPDWVSAEGMRLLGKPAAGDPTVISGESGAVGTGLVAALMTDDACADLRKAIGLDRTSRALLFSTEGDTAPDNYRRVLESAP